MSTPGNVVVTAGLLLVLVLAVALTVSGETLRRLGAVLVAAADRIWDATTHDVWE